MRRVATIAIFLLFAACSASPEEQTAIAEGTVPPGVVETALSEMSFEERQQLNNLLLAVPQPTLTVQEAEDARRTIDRAISHSLAQLADTAEAQNTALASDRLSLNATYAARLDGAADAIGTETSLLAEERMNPVVVQLPAPTPVPVPTATVSPPDWDVLRYNVPVQVRNAILCLVIDGQDPELPALIEVSGIGAFTQGNAETLYDCIAVLEEYALGLQ